MFGEGLLGTLGNRASCRISPYHVDEELLLKGNVIANNEKCLIPSSLRDIYKT